MALPTIDCKECGHVNEGERVYCHNCGAKLDRSILLTTKQQQETLEQKQRRIKKMMSPGSGLFRNWWKSALKAIGAAVGTALVVDMILPPPGAPPMPKKGELIEILQLDLALENLAISPAGMRFGLKQDEINAYLKNKVRLKYEGSFIQSITSFQRTFVNLTPGLCRVTLQTSVLDYPLYLGATYELKIDSVHNEKGEAYQGVVATPVGANIGRLWVPGVVVDYAGFIFDPLWNALSREHRLVDQIGAIEIRKGEIIFTSRGPSPANRTGVSAPPAAPGAGRAPGTLGNPRSLQTGGLMPAGGLGR